LLSLLSLVLASDWIQYPPNGYATMTHYTLPEGFIAACGCAINSTLYPTAAMSQMAYGSSTSYGPACGQCFNLTLIDAFTASPPFYPNTTNSVVVKITDLCPYSKQGWCNATTSGPNAGGDYLNFDLSWPSASIPSTFFPSDPSYYVLQQDFGVWRASYQSVSCEYWEGWNDSAALGSVANLGYDSCCPDNPTSNSNDTCPSYSDQAGIS
ncbi:RlpA-like double-psi beta-barrel-protein domain-containing protein-containing protein, partial [Pisolithus croceorrhizus]